MRILFILFCSLIIFISPAAVAQAQTESSQFFQTPPNLSIPIPDLTFSDITVTEDLGADGQIVRTLDIPFIAQYVASLYKYAVAVSGVIAIVLMMVGGFEVMIDHRREGMVRINNALVGLALTLGTYLILFAVNPDLVNFSSLKIESARAVPFDLLVFEDKNTESQGFGTAFSTNDPLPTFAQPAQLAPNELDTLFQSYAACFVRSGKVLDWNILKNIAHIESGLVPTNGNDKYRGLFAESIDYCHSGIIGGGYDYLACDKSHDNRSDAETNTAAAAYIIDRNIQKILNGCQKDITLKEVILLSYVAHNNGPAVMNYVVNKGRCHLDEQEDVVAQYYIDEDLRDGVKDERIPCTSGSSCDPETHTRPQPVTAEYGKRKWRYGFNAAKAFSSSSLGANAYVAKINGVSCQRDLNKRLLGL